MSATDTNLQNPELTRPFNFDDADIIIRARGADFRVNRSLLSLTSSVFRNVFPLSLPRDRTTTNPQDPLPIIDVGEDAQTMHDILSLTYLDDPQHVNLDDFATLHRLSLAARKYSMDNIKLLLRVSLQIKTVEYPIRAFAIACNARLPDVARNAARMSLSFDYGDISTMDFPELCHLRASSMRKLLAYHKRCGEVASQVVHNHRSNTPLDRKSTRLNSSHSGESRMPSSA